MRVVCGGEVDVAQRYVAPTVIAGSNSAIKTILIMDVYN